MTRATAKFREAITRLQPMLPGSDDPLFDFYRNQKYRADPSITMPFTFFLKDRVVAEADFTCLPSPHQLVWVALKEILKVRPHLGWDAVTMNNGPHRPKAQVEKILADNADMLTVPKERSLSQAFSAFGTDLVRMAQTGPSADLGKALEDAKQRLALRISLNQYDIAWRSGGPRLLERATVRVRNFRQ